MALLSIANLHVHYGGIHALRGISFDVNAGEVVALIGANGAGKTTTMRAISGLLRPSQGTVTWRGNDITGKPAHTIARQGIAHAPEGRGIFANMTVAENLELGAYMRRGDATLARDLEHVRSLFPRLGERMEQNAGTLSGGEQQMLAMGRALLAKPALLLLDEPSLGLAPQIVATIFRIIRTIAAEGTTILLVEQNARLALSVASTAHVLEVGELAASGKASDLASDDRIRKAYLGVH